jgi:hypothetical protein
LSTTIRLPYNRSCHAAYPPLFRGLYRFAIGAHLTTPRAWADGDPGGIALDNPTGQWLASRNPVCHIELFGTFTPPSITKVEIYRKVNNGQYGLAGTATVGVTPQGTPYFTWAENLSTQFVGDTLTYYALLYYTFDGQNLTKQSGEKSITVPAPPKN